jgi:hypothetical protein
VIATGETTKAVPASQTLQQEKFSRQLIHINDVQHAIADF